MGIVTDEIRDVSIGRLLKQSKLLLILDLDHTLVHAAAAPPNMVHVPGRWPDGESAAL